MRAVFHPPASIVSVVLAPRAVNSEASPTRPERPESDPSMPAAFAGCCEAAGDGLAVETAEHRRVIVATIARTPRPYCAHGAVLEVAHVRGGAFLVGFRAADPYQHPGAVAGPRHVGPAERRRIRPTQATLKQLPGDCRVNAPALLGGCIGLAAAPGAPRYGRRCDGG